MYVVVPPFWVSENLMSATTENSTVLDGNSTDIDYILMDVLVVVFIFFFGSFIFVSFLLSFFHCFCFFVFVAYCTVRETSCIVFDIHSYD